MRCILLLFMLSIWPQSLLPNKRHENSDVIQNYRNNRVINIMPHDHDLRNAQAPMVNETLVKMRSSPTQHGQ